MFHFRDLFFIFFHCFQYEQISIKITQNYKKVNFDIVIVIDFQLLLFTLFTICCMCVFYMYIYVYLSFSKVIVLFFFVLFFLLHKNKEKQTKVKLFFELLYENGENVPYFNKTVPFVPHSLTKKVSFCESVLSAIIFFRYYHRVS